MQVTKTIFGLFKLYEMCAFKTTSWYIVPNIPQSDYSELLLFHPSLLHMRPYSIARSRQRWAALRTGACVGSSALAKTERISSASLSISFSARLLSACITFIMITTPRCLRSTLSLSNKAWKISNQWLVCRGRGARERCWMKMSLVECVP